MAQEPLYPDDIDPTKTGCYYYKESKALRVITDDGDLWLGPSLTEPGGLFIAVGDEAADPCFVIQPSLLEVLSTYVEMLTKMWEETKDGVEVKPSDDEDYPQGEWPGQ